MYFTFSISRHFASCIGVIFCESQRGLAHSTGDLSPEALNKGGLRIFDNLQRLFDSMGYPCFFSLLSPILNLRPIKILNSCDWYLFLDARHYATKVLYEHQLFKSKLCCKEKCCCTTNQVLTIIPQQTRVLLPPQTSIKS